MSAWAQTEPACRNLHCYKLAFIRLCITTPLHCIVHCLECLCCAACSFPSFFLLQANAGPWVRLAEETGALIKWWRVKEGPPFSTSMDDLQLLLTDKTKIVALPHVSNLLGEVYDVAAVVKAVRNGPAGQCAPATW